MAIYGFQQRMSSAAEKESADEALLESKYKCIVTPFGQGQLPTEARQYLHRHQDRLGIRWLPDRLVIRPALYHAGIAEWMWLIDSKYSSKHDPENPTKFSHWLVEKAAHETHRLQRAALGLPIVYIWPDGCTCSYVDDLTDELLISAPYYGYGSGTPSWKFPKDKTRTLDEVFGKGVAA